MNITLKAAGDLNADIRTSASFLASIAWVVTAAVWIGGAPGMALLSATAATVIIAVGLLCTWLWPSEERVIAIGRRRITIETPKLEIPSKYFMPYCACPKCGSEGLHWMKTAEIDENDETALLLYYEKVIAEQHWRAVGALMAGVSYSALRQLYAGSRKERLAQARQWARERAEDCDLIRECRDCGNTWGQKVGAMELLAA